MKRVSRFIVWVVLLITLPFFFLGGPDWLSSPLYRALWDLGHFAFFALLLVTIQMYRPLTHWRQWITVGTLVLVIGGVIEMIQAQIGRDGTWADVAHNLIGAALGLFWGQKPSRLVWVGRCLASLALLPSVVFTINIALVQYESARQLPLLAGFETRRELLRWRGDVMRTAEHASEGQHSLKITFGTAKYSGVSLRYFLGDWSSYQRLSFDIYNPDTQAFTLALRIHDTAHDRADMAYEDRFNVRLPIHAGWNHHTISLADVKQAPLQREMDLQQLRALGLFTVQLPSPRVIYLDNLRLE